MEETEVLLASIIPSLETLVAYDFSKSFISNRHRIDLRTKWAHATFGSGNQASAIETLDTFADGFPVPGKQGEEIEFDFQAWEQAVDYFMRHGQLQLAAIANREVIEVIEFWGEPARARPRIMETLEAAIQTAAILEAL